MAKPSKLTYAQLIKAAETLLADWTSGDVDDLPHGSDYVRGIVELIGQVKLDVLRQGAGTVENALIVAERLGVSEPYNSLYL